MEKKVAVLSDIHGNYVALEACMEYCRERGVTTYIFLGDYIGEAAYPERTMERLYATADKYECYFIRGDLEERLLEYRAADEEDSLVTDSLLYCYSRLTEWDFSFFEMLPIVREVAFEGFPALTACHGSTERVDEKMLPGSARTGELLEKCRTDVLFCGHTHVLDQFVKGRKMLINAGAVGLPVQKGAKAQFVLLTGEKAGWRGEVVELDYDAARVISEREEVFGR